MKQPFLLFILLSTVALAHAQPPEGLYYFKEGKTVLTIYNKKGTITGAYTYLVSGLQNNSHERKAVLHTVRTNEKGEITEEITDTAIYDAAGLHLALGVDRMGKRVWLNYPMVMQKGRLLEKKITFTEEKTERGKRVKNKITISNRRVAGIEPVTYATRVYDCYKITYAITIPVKIAGIKMPFELTIKEWFHPALGIMKQEVRYNDELIEYYTLDNPMQ